jgi:hypothetical protein
MATLFDIERRARLVTDLATITLLIDAGIVSAEEAAQRIELIQRLMPESFQTDPVSLELKAATGYLRQHAPQDRVPWQPAVIQGGKPDHESES